MSGGIEDQGATIAEGDFSGLPGGPLVEQVELRLGWGSRLVEPIQVRLVIGDPLFDRLPRWLDGLHGADAEGWRWRSRKRRRANRGQGCPARAGCQRVVIRWLAGGCGGCLG